MDATLQHTMWSDRLAAADRRLADLQTEIELREAAIEATCGAHAPATITEQHTTSSFRAWQSPTMSRKHALPPLATTPQHAAATLAAAAVSEAVAASMAATRAAVIAQVNASAAASEASSPRITVSELPSSPPHHCADTSSIHEKQLQLEAALQRARKLGKVVHNQGAGLKAQVRSAKASLATAEAVAKAKDEMLQTRQQELAKTRVDLRRTCEQLASMKAEHKALQQERDALASKQHKHTATHQQVASDLAFAKTELATLKAQLSDLTGAALVNSPRSTRAMQSLRHEASSLAAELQALKQLRQEDQSRLASLQTAYEQLRQENAQHQAAAARSDAALQQSQHVLRSSQKLQDALQTATSSIQALQGRAEGMEQVVASKDMALNQLQQENNTLRAQLSECLHQVERYAGLHQQTGVVHGSVSSLPTTWSPTSGNWSPKAGVTWPPAAVVGASIGAAAGMALGSCGSVPLPQLHLHTMQGSGMHSTSSISPSAVAISGPYTTSSVASGAAGMQHAPAGSHPATTPHVLSGASTGNVWHAPMPVVLPGAAGPGVTGVMPDHMLHGVVPALQPGVVPTGIAAADNASSQAAAARYQQAMAELQAAHTVYMAEQQQQQTPQQGSRVVEAGQVGAAAGVQERAEQQLVALQATVRAASEQIKEEARRSQERANKEADADKARLAEVSAELASKTTELARHRADLETAAQMVADSRTVSAQLAEQLRSTTAELQHVTTVLHQQQQQQQHQPPPVPLPQQQQYVQQEHYQQQYPQQHAPPFVQQQQQQEQEQLQQPSQLHQYQQQQQQAYQPQQQAGSAEVSPTRGLQQMNTASAPGGKYMAPGASMPAASDTGRQGAPVSPASSSATATQKVAWGPNAIYSNAAGTMPAGSAPLPGSTRTVGFGSAVHTYSAVDRPSETNTDTSVLSATTGSRSQAPPPQSNAAAALGWLSVPTQTAPVYGHDAAHQTQRAPTREEGDEDLGALLVYMDDELAAMAGGLADREAVTTSLKSRMAAVKQLLSSRLGPGANSAQGGARGASSGPAPTASAPVSKDAPSVAAAATSMPPGATVPPKVTVPPVGTAAIAAVPASPRQPPLSPSAGAAASHMPRSLAAMRVAIPASGQATPAMQSFAYRSPHAANLTRIATRKVERTISSASRNTDAPEPSPRAVPYNKSYSMHYQALSKSYDAGPSSPSVGGQQDVKSLLSQAAEAVQAASRTSVSGGRTFPRPIASMEFSRSSTLGRDSITGPATGRAMAGGAVGSASSRMLDAYKAVTSWAAANASADPAASLESFDNALADLRANSSDLG